MKRALASFMMLALILMISSCSAPQSTDTTSSTSSTSSSSSSSSTSSNTTTTVPDVAAIKISASTSTIATNGTTTISVSLYGSSGQIITGSKTVTFSLDDPTLASIAATATTSSGSLSQTLTARSTEGTVTLTASVDGQSASQAIQISDTLAASTVNVTANPASIAVGGTSVVSATVLDSGGNPMADGTTVNFSVDNTSLGTIVASATVAGGAGIAQATFSAGNTSGTATITATSGSASGTTNIAVTVPDVAAIKLSANSSTIPTNGTTTILVSLFSSSGQLITSSKTVTFSLDDPTLASIAATATTSSGSLSQTLTARSTEGTVTLTASVDGQSASQAIQISNTLSASTINVSANPASITVGGTSVVSATVLDSGGNPMADGTTVNFSVDNTSLGTIVASASVAGGAGIAQATFSAGNTSGTATITATSGSASGTATIAVTAATAGSIEFLSANPQVIVIKGAGGVETSTIKFQVNDSTGNPISSSTTVHVVLTGPNGGEYIGSTPGITSLDVGTDSGIASAILHSGTVPGTATITATVVGTSLTTSSGVIAIGGGVPSASHFSLSTTTFNLEGLSYDGITTNINVWLADRYGNYNVLAGTAVSFYSESGAIDRAVNLDSEGYGTVTFRTQSPPPQIVPIDPTDTVIQTLNTDYSNTLGITFSDAHNPRNGLCTIVAVVDGEEEFTDANANGIYDLGESFTDTYDDIFLDKDDSPQDVPTALVTATYPFNPAYEDLIVDRNGNGTFDGLNGVWDSNKKISNQIKLLITGEPADDPADDEGVSVGVDGALIDPASGVITIPSGGSKRIYYSLHDTNFNPPIAGSTIKVSADAGTYAGKTSYTYNDTADLGAPIFSVTLTNTGSGTGTLTFSWTWKNNTYSTGYPILFN